VRHTQPIGIGWPSSTERIDVAAVVLGLRLRVDRGDDGNHLFFRHYRRQRLGKASGHFWRISAEIAPLCSRYVFRPNCCWVTGISTTARRLTLRVTRYFALGDTNVGSGPE
jgi:hypothetical protein